jgi:hypothetical protein
MFGFLIGWGVFWLLVWLFVWYIGRSEGDNGMVGAGATFSIFSVFFIIAVVIGNLVS